MKIVCFFPLALFLHGIRVASGNDDVWCRCGDQEDGEDGEVGLNVLIYKCTL